MKKHIISLILAFICVATYGQTKEIYTNPNFASIAKDHKEMAILPFHVIMELRPNQRKKMSEDEYYKMVKFEGLAVQSALESYFLKRKMKHDFIVNFQNAAKTNAILEKNNINNENISTYTPEELAKLLGVDAVITGIFQTSKPMSDGAALALGLLVGVSGPTNSGKVSININDGAKGDLVWKYEKTLSRGLGSDTNSIINAIMRKASKKFPYNKI